MGRADFDKLIMVKDGGGSTCRARLVDRDGVALGSATGGAANLTSDFELALQNIIETAAAGYRDAGLEPAQAASDGVFLALAGDAQPGRVAKTLRAGLAFADISLTSDLDAGVSGALGGGDGVVVNVGTGSYFVAQRGGTRRRVGGYGHLLSDEGSGAWLGLGLLREVVRCHDGRESPSRLTEDTLALCGGTVAGVVAFARQSTPRDLAALAPRIVAAERSADPVARRLITQALDEICANLDAIGAVNLGRIVFIGGLAGVYRRLLPEPYRGLCRDPEGSTLDGAVQLALRAFCGKP